VSANIGIVINDAAIVNSSPNSLNFQRLVTKLMIIILKEYTTFKYFTMNRLCLVKELETWLHCDEY
jgi:hypothetical protein